MINKISPNQFFNNWVRTNLDPDGVFVDTFISGGANDTYQNWLKSKEIETKSLDFKASKTDENTKNQDNISTVDRKYKWVYDGSDCLKCRSLDGKIFDYKPNIEEISHPNCECKVVGIGEREAEALKVEREVELRKRDDVAKYIRDNVKIEKNGKWYNPITRLEEKNGKYGDCARYVSNAIQAEFPNYKRVRDAKDSGGSLEKIGFMKIPTGKNYEPDVGDVKVYQPYDAFEKNGKKYPASSKAGHIQMFDGKQWISDFKQGETPRSIANKDNGMYANDGYENSNTQSQVYRHIKWQGWDN